MQAALGLVPMDLAMTFMQADTASFEAYKTWSEAINMTAVLAILICTPISWLGIKVVAPRLIKVNWKLPGPCIDNVYTAFVLSLW
jgi:hypothetical protein